MKRYRVIRSITAFVVILSMLITSSSLTRATEEPQPDPDTDYYSVESMEADTEAETTLTDLDTESETQTISQAEEMKPDHLTYENSDVVIQLTTNEILSNDVYLQVTPITPVNNQAAYVQASRMLANQLVNTGYNVVANVLYDITLVDASGRNVPVGNNCVISFQYKGSYMPANARANGGENTRVCIAQYAENSNHVITNVSNLMDSGRVQQLELTPAKEINSARIVGGCLKTSIAWIKPVEKATTETTQETTTAEERTEVTTEATTRATTEERTETTTEATTRATTEEKTETTTEITTEATTEDVAPEIATTEEIAEEVTTEEIAEETTTEEKQQTDTLLFEAEDGELRVSVEAEDGAFPYGTTMRVQKVESDAILDSVTSVVEGTVTDMQAANISFYNMAGKEIEPEKPIRVYIGTKQIAAKADTPIIVHISDDAKAEVVKPAKDAEKGNDEVVFDADTFSTYAVVYTVDFSFEKDGKNYEYSMEGGSAISLKQLLVSLGIQNEAEVNRFVEEDVENVTFSNDSLVKVSKIEKETSLMQLKQEAQADTEESDSNTIFAPVDWVLLSVGAFDTDEVLTLRLKSGVEVEIKVTDAQVADKNQLDSSKGYLIYAEWDGNYCVLKNDGSTLVCNRQQLDALGNEYKWRFIPDGSYYRVQSVADGGIYLDLSWYDTIGTRYNLASRSSNQIEVVNQGNNTFTIKAPGTLFLEFGYLSLDTTYGEPHLASKWTGFQATTTSMHIYEQEQSNIYTFNVKTANESQGLVSGFYPNGSETGNVSNFTTVTDASYNTKTNSTTIQAIPGTNMDFAGWKWEGESYYIDTNDKLNPGTLKVNANGKTLVAEFKQKDMSKGRDVDKEALQKWVDDLLKKQIPINDTGVSKTAEVYDYENRIYRIDLTGKSNLATFAGNIDLGFILDASNSMKFPSKLERITISAFGNQYQTLRMRHINDSNDIKNMLPHGPNDPKYYYIIADPHGTATVIRIFWKNGSWWAVDAAFDDNSDRATQITTSTAFHSADYNGGQIIIDEYPVYIDADSGKNRKYYLEHSVNTTLDHMKELVNKVNVGADNSSNVKVAYNTFASKILESHDFANITNNTFQITLTTEGGTSTDLALNDATNSFNWTGTSKYAVLITDGAPQKSGKAMQLSEIEPYATALKNKGVTLITVGLSLDDVELGRNILYNIASPADASQPNGDKLFYRAESADQLEYILYEILQKVMSEATVQSNVKDTIDSAFYPVDKASGTKLEAGDRINLEGEKINLPSWQTPTVPYGTVRKDNNNYYIEWSNQDVTWDGWHGSIYVKAKEDFLGGNTINTNKGDASFTPQKYYLNDDPSKTSHTLKNDYKKPVNIKTPYVNVNELEISQENSEWTVYLGTEVDPATQLKEMFKDIKVDLVVQNPGSDNRGGTLAYSLETDSVSDDREKSSASTKKDITEYITLTEDEWNQILSGTTLEKEYTAYEHQNIGKIQISLEKVPADQTVQVHKTTREGSRVEEYKLIVKYVPDATKAVGTDAIQYHTGTYGTRRPGDITGQMISENEHIINVFKKGLKLTKVSMSDETKKLSGAEFKLYRAAVDSDSSEKKVTVKNGNMDGSYVEVAAGTSDANGEITFEYISPDDNATNGVSNYYLVETKSPTGYAILGAGIPVTLTITDAYTTLPIPPATTGDSLNKAQLSGKSYDWTQTALLEVTESNFVEVKTPDAANAITTTNISYQVKNVVLYELPHSGGSGIFIYMIGGIICMIGAAFILLRMKEREVW